MPVLHLLAGPNGAGKSTYARDVLSPAMALPVINADVIAAEEHPGDLAAQAAYAYEASRIAEAQRRTMLGSANSFITETVFSHPSKVDLLREASALGYLVHLHVILVPVDLTVQRVAERVRRGGHTVPEQKVRSRYDRLWGFVATAIKIADVTKVLDNSSARHPFRPCATYVRGTAVGSTTWPRWVPRQLVER